MITYTDSYNGIFLFTRLFGSALPRAAFYATICGFCTWCVYHWGFSEDGSLLDTRDTVKSAVPYQIFTFVLGFALVFRSSLSYNRYWEARSAISTVWSRLNCVAVEALASDLIPSPGKINGTPEARMATFKFFHQLLHHVSLMFALMMMEARGDADTDDLTEHVPFNAGPPVDFGDQLTFGYKIATIVMGAMGLGDLMPNARPGSTLPVYGCLTEDENSLLRHEFGTGLPPWPDFEQTVQGARTTAIYARLQRLLFDRMEAGGMRAPPPINNRIMQFVSDAILAHGQLLKLASTQFPFPWTQVVMLFLLVLIGTLPFVMAIFVEEQSVGIIMSVIIVLTYCSLNEIAAEMEDPIGYDPNDLPMARFTYDFNQALWTSTWQLRPEWFTELEDQFAEVGAAAEAHRALSGDAERSLSSKSIQRLARMWQVRIDYRKLVGDAPSGGATAGPRSASPQPAPASAAPAAERPQPGGSGISLTAKIGSMGRVVPAPV